MKTRDYIITELAKRGITVTRYNLTRWISGAAKLNNFPTAQAISRIVHSPILIWMDKAFAAERRNFLQKFSLAKKLTFEGRGRPRKK